MVNNLYIRHNQGGHACKWYNQKDRVNIILLGCISIKLKNILTNWQKLSYLMLVGCDCEIGSVALSFRCDRIVVHHCYQLQLRSRKQIYC